MPESFVFLANYFGPSKLNVEVICYLFSLKIIVPNKVILWRGSSELGESNKNNLLPECLDKYGQEVGQQIWELLNDVLDKLSFGVLVHECILCIHSGLAKVTTLRTTDLDKIAQVVKNVEMESPLAYELLHNTPKTFESLDSAAMAEERIFSEGTFNSFMKLSELQLMIRGHDLCANGGYFYCDGRCITVCSTQSCESKAAVVFIDRSNSMIRFVCLEDAVTP